MRQSRLSGQPLETGLQLIHQTNFPFTTIISSRKLTAKHQFERELKYQPTIFPLRPMIKTASQILVIIFLAFFFPENGKSAEGDLKPHNVILRSLFQEKVKAPVIKEHHTELGTPGKIQEPYLPDFSFSVASLPDDFPQNTPTNWLTEFSPSLSRLFRGNDGRLNNGIYFYRRNMLDHAESELLPLLKQPSQFSEPAVLYLAWIKFKDGHWEETNRLTNQLLLSDDTNLVKEAYYLKSVVYLEQKQYEKGAELGEAMRARIPESQFDLKQSYVQLICLVQLGYWNEAEKLSNDIQKRSIAYTKQYYKTIELAALIDYSQGHYLSSLKKYLRARSYNAHPAYQFAMDRRIAWLYYITGAYEAALNTLQELNSVYFSDFADEFVYLRLACRVQLQQWSQVKPLLDGLKDTSLFHTYASFLVRTHLKNPTDHPALFNQVAQQNFDFPEMKFHVAILDGNLFFTQGQYPEAKDAFIRALSVDSSNSDYWIAQYNLGLTHLRLGQYSSAEADFNTLLRSINGTRADQLRYHLSYAQYQQSKPEETLNSLKLIHIGSLDRKQQVELKMMEGGSLLRLNKNDAARKVFLDIWHSDRKQDALELVAIIYYDQQQYSEVIKLVREHPEHRSTLLIVYEVKSLLAMRQFEEAKKTIEPITQDSDSLIELRLEVWTANLEYDRIITDVTSRLGKTTDPQKRRFYYLTLGDAYFNLQRYQESKNQFYRALNLTEEPTLKSLVLYNIALSSYYYKDYTSFLREVNQVLSRKEIDYEVRFNLTILLAEFYQKSGKLELSDGVLEKYNQSHSYNQASIHIKRVRLWFQSGNPGKCAKLGKTGTGTENDYQRRDRIIMFGYCANASQQPAAAINIIRKELKKDRNPYRTNELNFVLAQAYAQTGDFKHSLKLAKNLIIKPLNLKVRQDTQLLITRDLLELNEPEKARAELGNVNQYRNTQQYVSSLQLRSEIEFKQKQYHQAYRTLLRIYYLSDSSPIVRQSALLSLSEGYLKEKDLESAERHFRKIDPEIIKQEPSAQKRYDSVKSVIHQKKSLSFLQKTGFGIQGVFHVKQHPYPSWLLVHQNPSLSARTVSPINPSASYHGS